MTSSDYMVLQIADALHHAMCYRGKQTPICKGDYGDALLMVEDLRKAGWRLTRILPEEAHRG